MLGLSLERVACGDHGVWLAVIHKVVENGGMGDDNVMNKGW